MALADLDLGNLDPAEIAELLPYLTYRERRDVMEIIAQFHRPWNPLPGPQTMAFHSKADITGYGGAAGGGKTDLACGLSLTVHKRSIIYRRESAQLQAVTDRMESLIVWRVPEGRQIEFGGFPHLGNEKRYQGRPHDLKVFDELPEMLEAQVRFLMGWLRSDDPTIPQRILMTMNPPTSAEGRWVIPFFAPWLDDKHPNPAAEGELRYCTTIEGKDEWVEDGRPFVFDECSMAAPQGNGNKVYDFDPADYRDDRAVLIIKPMSRTFIFARVTDNPYYMASGYASKLQAMPEPLRSQMLFGDFKAGMEDDVWQVIPTEWIDAAMDRWRPRKAKGMMDSLGVDVAAGGLDDFVISPRHGIWWDELVREKGALFPQDGIKGAAHCVANRRDMAPIHIDVVGWGSAVYGQLISQGVQVIPVNGASGSQERTKSGEFRFANLRAEMIWRMREALDPTNPTPIELPWDMQLRADLAAYRWRLTPAGILIEPKEDMKKRLGRSPDSGDAVCMSNMATMRSQTLIDMLADAQRGPSGDYDRFAELGD
jgi:hypothetical protein